MIGRIPIVSVLYRVSRWFPALAAAMLEGRGPFRNTGEANIDDLGRYHRPLPGGLESIRQPVRLLHGTADGNVPIGVPRWAASHLPSASVHEIPESGHYFAVTSPDLVVGALLPAP